MPGSVDLAAQPEIDTRSLNDLKKTPADNVRDGVSSVLETLRAVRRATSAQFPPRDIFSRPSLRGILRKETSSQTSTESGAQNKDSTSKPRRDTPSGARRTVKFQLQEDEEEEDPPEAVPTRSRFMVTIKSHAAARKWQELEQKK